MFAREARVARNADERPGVICSDDSRFFNRRTEAPAPSNQEGRFAAGAFRVDLPLAAMVIPPSCLSGIDFMLRVGAVSYLNTRPLIDGLAERLSGWGKLSLNLPSRLAAQLDAGELDVALIPSIEYFRGVGDAVVSDAAIACRGPVWSVRLLSRVPPEQIRSLALDEGSRTSATLVRVLLDDAFGIRPQTMPLPMEADPEYVDADAVLLIGDRAMHPPTDRFAEIWDLGERWCQTNDLPFVFAMWVARQGLDPSQLRRLEAALTASRDRGGRRLAAIAAAEAGRHGLTRSDLMRYFTENLHFRLGPGEVEGLQLYQRRAFDLGLAPSLRPLRHWDEAAAFSFPSRLGNPLP